MRIHAIQTGTVAIKNRQRQGVGHGLQRTINTLFDRTWTEPLPIYSWVIKHPQGIIVIDTGMIGMQVVYITSPKRRYSSLAPNTKTPPVFAGNSVAICPSIGQHGSILH